MLLNINPLLEKIIEFNHLDENQISQLINPISLESSREVLVVKVANRIKEAIDNKEKIFICGDYDCDGLCSTSILVSTIRQCGGTVGFYIPNRFKDGYGINVDIVDQATEKKYDLFIMLDNGVSAYDAIDRIHFYKKQSMVIDHHEIHREVKSDYLLHPNYLSSFYDSLCTSGLVQLISDQLIGYDPYLCALAGLATIGDMMPLWNFNRSLVIQALKEINEHAFLPLTQLLKNPRDRVDEEVLSFQLVPKLNAVGRLADQANPNRIVDYLLLQDSLEILNLSQQILNVNENRKLIHQTMYQKAINLIDPQDAVIMVSDESFHEGVVGITAGQLSNQFKKVALVMHDDGKRLKGSVRSYGDIHLSKLFEPALVYVNRYGGHGAAAGIEIDKEQFSAFKEMVLANAVNFDQQALLVDTLDFDLLIHSLKNIKDIRQYGPFGMDFIFPPLLFKDVKIESMKDIKRGKKFSLSIHQKKFDALDFSQSYQNNLQSFYGKLSVNEYRGVESLTIFIQNWI